MSLSAVPQQSELLTSWKEIAAYLGKGVRTVQRWEQQYGLPVRRPNEKVKGIVHATRKDLDNWLAVQWSLKPQQMGSLFQSDSVWHTELRAGVEKHIELRHVNRLLVNDMRNCVESMILECQALARNMNGVFLSARQEII